MPKGGRRKGAGRPTRAQQEAKAKLLAETIAKCVNTNPKAYLQGVLNSPGSTKSERLRAAELLLKYPPDPAPHAHADPAASPMIIGIPRGVFLSDEQRANIEKLAVEHGQPIEPYEATPALHETSLSRSEPELERLEVVEVPDDGKITTLRPYGRALSNGRRLAAGSQDIFTDDDGAA